MYAENFLLKMLMWSSVCFMLLGERKFMDDERTLNIKHVATIPDIISFRLSYSLTLAWKQGDSATELSSVDAKR